MYPKNFPRCHRTIKPNLGSIAMKKLHLTALHQNQLRSFTEVQQHLFEHFFMGKIEDSDKEEED
jgi:hypothetical protein